MWLIEHSDEFDLWIETLDADALQAILANVYLLREEGPKLGRPYVDQVKGSRYKNMKELRVQNKNRVFRIFFIFAATRTGLLLIGGDKRGDKKFYERIIKTADKIYEKYLVN